MSKTWTRQHDAILAEKCEGLLVVGPFYDDYYWRVGSAEEDNICDRPVCAYNENIVDALRAAGKWSGDMPDHRGFWIGIDSCRDAGPEAELVDRSGVKDRRIRKDGDSLAGALAWALYEAVTR